MVFSLHSEMGKCVLQEAWVAEAGAEPGAAGPPSAALDAAEQSPGPSFAPPAADPWWGRGARREGHPSWSTPVLSALSGH